MATQYTLEIRTRSRGTTEITGKLLLGTWQGIYLWEHRTGAHLRRIVVTLVG